MAAHKVPTWNSHPDRGSRGILLNHLKVELLEGNDCTVISWGAMVHVAEQAIKDSE